jgi:hypothetical protein
MEGLQLLVAEIHDPVELFNNVVNPGPVGEGLFDPRFHMHRLCRRLRGMHLLMKFWQTLDKKKTVEYTMREMDYRRHVMAFVTGQITCMDDLHKLTPMPCHYEIVRLHDRLAPYTNKAGLFAPKTNEECDAETWTSNHVFSDEIDLSARQEYFLDSI